MSAHASPSGRHRRRIDLHTHSAASDGTDSPSELVGKAARLGLDVVALTDHDTFEGLASAQLAAQQVGIELFPGMELSTTLDGASVHLLAYRPDLTDPALNAELVRIRDGRRDRVGPVLTRLGELGVSITAEQVQAQAAEAESIGRPHIADALVAAGYVQDRNEAFTRWLADGGPADVPRYAPALIDAIDLVHAAGGAAVLAHPWSRQSRSLLSPEMITALVADHGLDGVEVDHHDHDLATRQALRTLVGELGIIATGSSDYHGTGKVDHELGSETTDPEMFDRLAASCDVQAGCFRFW